MRLTKAILLRLFYGLLSLIFISLVTFVADELAPGDRATMEAGEKASQATVQMLRHRYHLDQPWPGRYVEFIENAAKGDFGNSYIGTKEPVKDILARTAPMTIRLAIVAIILAAAIGIFFGTAAAVYQNRFIDGGVLTVSTLGVTVPSFVLAPLLVLLFSVQLNYLPSTWEVDLHGPIWMYLLLPTIVLAARPAALLTRLTRASMIDTLQQEFIRTATAKGVPPFRLIVRHGLRNAILPVITAIGTSFGFLLTGSFVIERVFSLPGLGSRAIEAIMSGDMPVIQATVMVTGAMFIVINLIVDMLLPLLDPRIRESQV